MAKVKVFLSFEFDKDNELYHNFYGQAAEHSCHQIEDYSLKEAYKPHNNSSWLKKARYLISCSVKCHRLFRPQFRKFNPSFVSEIP